MVQVNPVIAARASSAPNTTIEAWLAVRVVSVPFRYSPVRGDDGGDIPVGILLSENAVTSAQDVALHQRVHVERTPHILRLQGSALIRLEHLPVARVVQVGATADSDT